MPRQNKFLLVPNPMGMQGLVARGAEGPLSKPPMTSKQAHQLYNKQNGRPRISKAEQRAIEFAEQERLRKEHEKDKAAYKARTARDKRKAKEQQVRDYKRKKGLPLVDVRPSQDTISRFLRGNFLGGKRDSVGREAQLEPVAEDGEDPSAVEAAAHPAPPPQGKENDDKATQSQSEKRRIEIKDKSKSLPLPVAIREVAVSFSAAKSCLPSLGQTGSSPWRDEIKSSQEKLPRDPGCKRDCEPPSADEKQESMIADEQTVACPALDISSHPSPFSFPAVTSGGERAAGLLPKPPEPQVVSLEQTIKSPRLSQLPVTRRQPLQEISGEVGVMVPTSSTQKPLSMLPPVSLVPGPPRSSPAASSSKPRISVMYGNRPKFLPKHVPKPAQSASQAGSTAPLARLPASDLGSMAPSSTQLFIISHLDDLLPSPSQEARELSTTRPTAFPGPPRFLSVREPFPRPPRPAAEPTLSPRPPLSRRKPGPKPQHLARRSAIHSSGITAPSSPTITPDASNPLLFFSTQDLFLSSQDIRELESSSGTPSNAKTQPQRSLSSDVEPPIPDRGRPDAGVEKAEQIEASFRTHPDDSLGLPCKSTPDAEDKLSESSPSPVRRFFTSSGTGADLLVAIEQSKRAHQAEQRRRELDVQAAARAQREEADLLVQLAVRAEEDDQAQGQSRTICKGTKGHVDVGLSHTLPRVDGYLKGRCSNHGAAVPGLPPAQHEEETSGEAVHDPDLGAIDGLHLLMNFTQYFGHDDIEDF